jgi:hypothetical protein
LCLTASVVLADMTADDIINKYLESTGGIENHKDMKSMQMEGKAFMEQMPFDIFIANRAPNSFFMKFYSDMFTVIQATNGEEAWALQPMIEGYIFLEGEELEGMLEQAQLNPYLNYKERGGSMKLLGEEPVTGQDCYKIEFIKPTGDTTHLFFAKDNFHLLKETSHNNSMLYAKYKEVGGFQFPHKITMMPQGQRIMMVINSIEVDPELHDSLFTPPADSLRADPEALEKMKQMQEQYQKQQQESQEGE